MSSQSKPEVKIHIRWMIRRDMAEVIAIETESFEFPWSEDDFVRCLRQRNCIGMVAEMDDQVVGFMIYELHKNRLHILNFAVADRLPPAGNWHANGLQASGQALRSAPQPDSSGNSRNQFAGPTLFPRERIPSRVGAQGILRRHARRRYLMQYRHPADEPDILPFNRTARLAG